MIDLFVDTNVLIYLHGEHPTYMDYFRSLIGKKLGISVVSYMETVMGAGSDREEKELKIYLERFEIIPLDAGIAQTSVMKLRRGLQKNLRSSQMADTVIAETALALGVPLVTNNRKDFSRFKNLTLIVPEESRYRGQRLPGQPDSPVPPWLT